MSFPYKELQLLLDFSPPHILINREYHAYEPWEVMVSPNQFFPASEVVQTHISVTVCHIEHNIRFGQIERNEVSVLLSGWCAELYRPLTMIFHSAFGQKFVNLNFEFTHRACFIHLLPKSKEFVFTN